MNATNRERVWMIAMIVAPYLVFRYAWESNADLLLIAIATTAPYLAIYLIANRLDPVAVRGRSEGRP